jgi:nucleotide-binding universal stress UspA family protein
MKKLFDKILCPVDFDEPSMATLVFARELARENGATLTVLNVAPIPMNATEIAPIPLEPYPVWEQAARARLEKVVTDYLEGKGVAYKAETRSGEASAGILKQAEETAPDVIVMATHGRTGVSHFFIGSVAERVIRQADRPVLVIRPAGPAGTLAADSAR